MIRGGLINQVPLGAGHGAEFDPQEAADLLNQATAQARRTFTPVTPALLVFRAVLVLVVFGGFWLSVRGQHPYAGPTGAASVWVLLATFVLVAVNIAWSIALVRRAGAGVSGPAQRRWQAGVGVMLAAWILAYAVLAPRFHAEVTHPVWGLYPASGPLLIIGLVGLAVAAVIRDRRLVGTCLAITVVTAVAGFGGPAGAWLIMAIGLCAVMLAAAGLMAWAPRRDVVRS